MPTSLDETFAREHRPLWGLCYRMTGSAADADEIVQETFARVLERPPADASRSLGPWLRTVALNLSRDRLRRRRETYVGAFLPEPLDDAEVTAPHGSPEARYSLAESATWAFLIALEALGEKQRAVLVLRDVYDLSTRETAEALELGESHVKVLLHRARKALEVARAPTTPPQEAATAMARFFAALASDDVAAMTALLREDVVFVSDGAGEVHAARRPVVGRDRVILFHRRTRPAIAPAFALRSVNGAPTLVYRQEPDVPPGVPPAGAIQLWLDSEGRIARILSVAAPSKLARYLQQHPVP